MLLVQGKRSSCNELVKTSYKCDNKKGTIQNNMKIKVLQREFNLKLFYKTNFDCTMTSF